MLNPTCMIPATTSSEFNKLIYHRKFMRVLKPTVHRAAQQVVITAPKYVHNGQGRRLAIRPTTMLGVQEMEFGWIFKQKDYLLTLSKELKRSILQDVRVSSQVVESVLTNDTLTTFHETIHGPPYSVPAAQSLFRSICSEFCSDQAVSTSWRCRHT